MSKPKVLLLDIETAPMIGHVWSLWKNDIGLNQLMKDWHLLSWCAKWLDKDKIMYEDQSRAKDVSDDKKLLKGIWQLIDEADVIITQNGIDFDMKKLNARFILNGMKPPSTVKHIDTKRIASKHFAFTSNRLEYMTDKLCVKYKKLKHKKFPGHEMWVECLKGNRKAWKEMKKYNMHDVLALEELYKKLIPWDSSINFSIYSDSEDHVCTCGSKDLVKYGYAYTAKGKFQRYQCKDCGKEMRSSENLFHKEKKKSLLVGTTR